MVLTNSKNLIRQRFNICAPIGGFGNHVRWIVLLDHQFNFLIKNLQDNYLVAAGESWPCYDDYVNNNFKQVDSKIYGN